MIRLALLATMWMCPYNVYYCFLVSHLAEPIAPPKSI